MTIRELEALLTGAQADFQLIQTGEPIRSVSDAEKYYPHPGTP